MEGGQLSAVPERKVLLAWNDKGVEAFITSQFRSTFHVHCDRGRSW
jgi:hypothetical protein